MNRVKVKDKEFEPFISGSRIQQVVGEIADRINRDYEGKKPLFLCILNGSFIFAADLLRNINLPCSVSFVKYASYSGTSSTHYIKNLIGLNENLEGKDVIIVEDIIDTGLTVDKLLKEFPAFKPASVRIATCFLKPDAFEGDYKIDYYGMEIPNDFVVGYGLDYDGFGRNLPDLYKLVS